MEHLIGWLKDATGSASTKVSAITGQREPTAPGSTPPRNGNLGNVHSASPSSSPRNNHRRSEDNTDVAVTEGESRIAGLGGTVILYSTNVRDLKFLEIVMEVIIYVTCSLKLEMSLFSDSLCQRSESPLRPNSSPSSGTVSSQRTSSLFASKMQTMWSWFRSKSDDIDDSEDHSMIDISALALRSVSDDGPADESSFDELFEKAVCHFESTLLSSSPDVYLPPPHLLVRLRDEAIRRRAQLEREKSTLSRKSVITPDSKSGLGYYMFEGSKIIELIKHQSITFSYSFYMPPKALAASMTVAQSTNSNLIHTAPPATCQTPKILTVEFYKRSGLNEDKTIGEYIHQLCSPNRGNCPDPACSRPIANHIITYTHNNCRISVSVESITKQLDPSANEDDMVFMWTSCKICGAATEGVQMSDATWFYSFGKYLELLCYSRRTSFYKPELCGHVSSHASLVQSKSKPPPVRRWFRVGDRAVVIDTEEVELFEISTSRYHVVGDRFLSPQESKVQLARKVVVGGDSIVNYISSGENGAVELDDVEQDDDVLELPLPFGLDVASDEMFDTIRGEICAFYASVYAHMSALDLALPDGPVGPVFSARQALRDLEVAWRSHESNLLTSLVDCAVRPDRVSNIRRSLDEKIKVVTGGLESWAKNFGTAVGLGKTVGSFALPEYSTGKGAMVYPDSFVIVRDEEPTSIIAFTLTSKEYLREVKKLELQHRTTSSTDNTGSLLQNTIGVSPMSTANSPTLSATAASAAAMAVAAAASAAVDLTRWESQDEYRTKVYVQTHEQTPSAPKQHVKLRFGEGKHVFVCTVYYAEQFENLRRRCNISGLYIQSLLRCFAWNSSGGKSKASFFKTHDDQLVIKQLKSDWTVTEKDALLKFAPSYFQHINNVDKNPSVLAKIFGFFTVKHKNLATGVTSEIDVLVMEHLFANVRISRKFDLKGVPERHSTPKRAGSGSSASSATGAQSESNSVGWDGDWVDGRYQSLLLLHGHSKKIIMDAITNDTAFLASANVMDYSLLVGINDERHELVVGIVDFIGPYTWYRRLETQGKAMARGGKENVTVVPPDSYGERFRQAMEMYFLMIPDKWIKLDDNYDGGGDGTAAGRLLRYRNTLPSVL